MNRVPLLFSLAVFLFSTSVFPQSIVQVIPLPGSSYWDQAWGLTADATGLYIASNTSDDVGRKIVKLSFTGQAMDSVSAPSGVNSSQGLAKDASGFYYVRRYTAVCTILKISSAGSVVDSLRLPSGKYCGGVAWDGNFVWYSLYYPNELAGLYKLNFTTKTVVDSILTRTKQPYGVTWDGTYLYYAENGFDGDRRGIYRINPATHDTAGFIPEPVDANGTSPHGVAWDGHYMWLLAEPVGANSGRALYKYDLGGGGTPDIRFLPDSVSLGYCRIGTVYHSGVEVRNVGTAPLRIDSIGGNSVTTWSGGFPTQPPFTIQPNSSATFNINFQPPMYGAYQWTPYLYSNDPDEPVKYMYAWGFGISATPSITAPPAYDFGSRRVGSSNFWLMSIGNRGGPGLVISSIAMGNRSFSIDSVSYPVIIDSLQTKVFRIWYKPSAAAASVDTVRITSNATNGPVTSVVVRGTGDATPVSIAQPFWTFSVPDNPRTSSSSKLVRAVRAISDITGDGRPEVVISAENYLTMAVNGNASGTSDTLWTFNTFISNYSAGAIGTTGDYSYQKALAVADLNNDGIKDVIIGTGGGNEHVYALNGRNGQILWQFGTDSPDSFSLGDFTGVDASTDFNHDGVPEVLAAAGATDAGGLGGRRSIYLFNGANGSIMWQSPLPGFTHAVAVIGDVNGDGVPDVVGCVGDPSDKVTAYSGANGASLWDFPMTSASGGGKEALPWPVAGHASDVIVSAFWGPIYRINGATGAQVWSCPTGGNGVMQLLRIRDVTGDGVDDIIAPLLLGGVYCVNGATGSIVWSLPTGNTMGAAVVPDLNGDGYDDVALAVQNQGTMFVKGQNGLQLGLYQTGSNQSREVAMVHDVDGNNSAEIIMGGQQGNVALLSGGLGASAGVGVQNVLPQKFELGQNYPNPFNPATTINIGLPVVSDVSLTVYDVLGREVRNYTYEHVPPGVHQIVWDGKNKAGLPAASGVYYYQARFGSHIMSKSMLLVK